MVAEVNSNAVRSNSQFVYTHNIREIVSGKSNGLNINRSNWRKVLEELNNTPLLHNVSAVRLFAEDQMDLVEISEEIAQFPSLETVEITWFCAGNNAQHIAALASAIQRTRVKSITIAAGIHCHESTVWAPLLSAIAWQPSIVSVNLRGFQSRDAAGISQILASGRNFQKVVLGVQNLSFQSFAKVADSLSNCHVDDVAIIWPRTTQAILHAISILQRNVDILKFDVKIVLRQPTLNEAQRSEIEGYLERNQRVLQERIVSTIMESPTSFPVTPLKKQRQPRVHKKKALYVPKDLAHFMTTFVQ